MTCTELIEAASVNIKFLQDTSGGSHILLDLPKSPSPGSFGIINHPSPNDVPSILHVPGFLLENNMISYNLDAPWSEASDEHPKMTGGLKSPRDWTSKDRLWPIRDEPRLAIGDFSKIIEKIVNLL
jgi:hypothetical protein